MGLMPRRRDCGMALGFMRSDPACRSILCRSGSAMPVSLGRRLALPSLHGAARLLRLVRGSGVKGLPERGSPSFVTTVYVVMNDFGAAITTRRQVVFELLPTSPRLYFAFAGFSRFVSLPCLLDGVLSARLRLSARRFSALGSTSTLSRGSVVGSDGAMSLLQQKARFATIADSVMRGDGEGAGSVLEQLDKEGRRTQRRLKPSRNVE